MVRRRLVLVLVFVIGILLTILATRTLYQFATNTLIVELERDADALTNILQARIDAALEMQYSLKALFAVEPAMTATRFKSFTTELLSHNSDFQAISWRPRIPLSERPQFEATGKQANSADFQIYENVNGQRVRAPERSVYYPIVFNEPMASNSTALGLNTIQGLPDSVPTDEIVRDLNVFTTPPIRLVQTGNVGFVVYQVITAENDPQHILGLTSVVMQATTLIETAFAKYDTRAFSIYLYDSAVPDGKLLYINNSIHQSTDAPPEGDERYQTSVALPHRVWTIEFHISNALIDQRRSRAWLFVISSGLILTALLTYHLYQQQQHAAALARRSEAIRLQNAHIQRLNQMKDDMIRVVSHDLRNPLTNIMGYSMLIQEMEPEVGFAHMVNQIYSGSEHMLEMINALLDIQQIENGLVVNLTQVSLAKIMHESMLHNTLAATKKTITITPELPPPDFNVTADAPRLVQVFDNLLSNAIKYAPAGSNIEFEALPQQGRVVIEVRDKGLGVPPDALGHLFEKFYRVQTDQHMAADGIGLGLSIVKLLVDKHHGEVGVRNNPTGGSTFYVILPLPPQKKSTAELAR